MCSFVMPMIGRSVIRSCIRCCRAWLPRACIRRCRHREHPGRLDSVALHRQCSKLGGSGLGGSESRRGKRMISNGHIGRFGWLRLLFAVFRPGFRLQRVSRYSIGRNFHPLRRGSPRCGGLRIFHRVPGHAVFMDIGWRLTQNAHCMITRPL